MEKETREQNNVQEKETEQRPQDTVEIPAILDEVNIEELAVDGICGIY